MYNKFNIGLFDKNGIEFKINDKVLFLGEEGEICYECGAFGIAFENHINYNKIEKELCNMDIYNLTRFYGVFNDNFISFWEIYWNFDCEDNYMYNIEIIKK